MEMMQGRSKPSDTDHERPAGVTDEMVDAIGKVSEALEWVERARGRLYDFHQMMGRADLLFGDAADALAAAGAIEASSALDREVVGRNVLRGRWTFQLVEEFDDDYYEPVRAIERKLRNELMDGKRHIWEAEYKERRRTAGHPAHTRRPDTARARALRRALERQCLVSRPPSGRSRNLRPKAPPRAGLGCRGRLRSHAHRRDRRDRCGAPRRPRSSGRTARRRSTRRRRSRSG